MHKPVWNRLVRFIAVEDGKEHYGQPAHPLSEDIGLLFLRDPSKLRVKILSPDADPFSPSCAFAKPERTMGVKRLLPPVDVKRHGASIRCLGTNFPIGPAKKPPFPILFYKPYTALAGFGDKIVVPKEVQDQTDYEVELVIVIGKQCKNVSPQEADDYIVGYTICNDVSARKRMFATPQWGMGKSFDTFLPLGPCLVPTYAMPSSPHDLQLTTTLTNAADAVRAKALPSNPVQNDSTASMFWKIRETVSALSYGTTLVPGDIVCMGTPDGQGSNRKPPVWLSHGDRVTVHGQGIGSLVNDIEWEGAQTPVDGAVKKEGRRSKL